ncbi:hypothetical protein PybrP1_002553 [[Pythium] brassicae (nom. inval.)]|nr:hypothetical protein PybrP1_002553 [[Pythium] brassicae (nom. inval.)]
MRSLGNRATLVDLRLFGLARHVGGSQAGGDASARQERRFSGEQGDAVETRDTRLHSPRTQRQPPSCELLPLPTSSSSAERADLQAATSEDWQASDTVESASVRLDLAQLSSAGLSSARFGSTILGLRVLHVRVHLVVQVLRSLWRRSPGRQHASEQPRSPLPTVAAAAIAAITAPVATATAFSARPLLVAALLLLAAATTRASAVQVLWFVSTQREPTSQQEQATARHQKRQQTNPNETLNLTSSPSRSAVPNKPLRTFLSSSSESCIGWPSSVRPGAYSTSALQRKPTCYEALPKPGSQAATAERPLATHRRTA